MIFNQREKFPVFSFWISLVICEPLKETHNVAARLRAQN